MKFQWLKVVTALFLSAVVADDGIPHLEVAGRRLNGDESHQGRHVRLPPETFGIQRVKLHAYH